MHDMVIFGAYNKGTASSVINMVTTDKLNRTTQRERRFHLASCGISSDDASVHPERVSSQTGAEQPKQ